MSICTVYKSSLIGDLLLVKDSLLVLKEVHFEEDIAGILESRKYTVLKCTDPAFADTVHWFDRYFAGKTPGRKPQFSQRGTHFRETVWDELSLIPYGSTMSYSEMAERIAEILGREKMSARAVGGAVGHNNLPIIVPCHRVIGKDGSLMGFAGGKERKAALLRLEGASFKY